MLAPYLHETFASDPDFAGTKCVFTIHNLGYQGNFPGYLIADLGLSPALFNPQGLEFWGELSFLKAGIVWADAITTVSPTYAREIQTPEYGLGLDGVLRDRAAKITGILNGVDYTEWNPENDPHLTNRFSAQRPFRQTPGETRAAQSPEASARHEASADRHRLPLRLAKGFRSGGRHRAQSWRKWI